MSAYLARLKQLDDDKYFQHPPDTFPTEPTKGAFDGFDGTGTGYIEKIFTETECIASPEPDCIDTLAIDYAELNSLIAELCMIAGHTDDAKERMLAARRYLYPYQVAEERDCFRLQVEQAKAGKYWKNQSTHQPQKDNQK
jgi:hypothetical protein